MVFCSSRTLNNLPSKNDEVSLLIETHVREDHIHLYGFETAMDKEWFKMLQSVQGVGAKVALAILSVLDSVNLFNDMKAKRKNIQVLSLGTSSDFKECIKAGSNLIRVGEILFGPRL